MGLLTNNLTISGDTGSVLIITGMTQLSGSYTLYYNIVTGEITYSTLQSTITLTGNYSNKRIPFASSTPNTLDFTDKFYWDNSIYRLYVYGYSQIISYGYTSVPLASVQSNYQITQRLYMNDYNIQGTENGYRMAADISPLCNDSTFTGTLSEQTGIRVQYGSYIDSGSGTIDYCKGLVLDAINSGNATITNKYHIEAKGGINWLSVFDGRFQINHRVRIGTNWYSDETLAFMEVNPQSYHNRWASVFGRYYNTASNNYVALRYGNGEIGVQVELPSTSSKYYAFRAGNNSNFYHVMAMDGSYTATGTIKTNSDLKVGTNITFTGSGGNTITSDYGDGSPMYIIGDSGGYAGGDLYIESGQGSGFDGDMYIISEVLELQNTYVSINSTMSSHEIYPMASNSYDLGSTSSRWRYLYVGTEIRCYGDVVAYYSSDENLKTNIEKIENANEIIKNISGYKFNWKKDVFNNIFSDEDELRNSNDKEIGVIAQEIEKVLPEVVKTKENGYKSVDYSKLTALLIEAVKEQNNEIEKLKSEIEKLKR